MRIGSRTGQNAKAWHGARASWLGGVSGVLSALLGLAMIFAVVLVSRSQTPGQNVGPPGSNHIYYPEPRSTPIGDFSDQYTAVETARRINALNVERQKDLVSDTNKLLKLARELNSEIAANNTGAWTDEQLHKLAEIEKLAHNVKQRMADGVPQPVQPMPAPLTLPAQ